MIPKLTYSVVVPLFNKRETINRALNSVMAQEHGVEVIVIDDGSTDDGPEIVRNRQDPRISIIHQQNRGVSAARNRGFTQANNELVALIDADDEWDLGFLDTIDNLIVKYPSAGAYATSYRLVKDSGITLIHHPKLKHPYIGVPDYFYCVRYQDYFCSSSIVVRKQAMKHINGFRTDLLTREDSDAWGRLAFTYQIAYCSDVKATYWCLQGDHHKSYTRDPITLSFVDSANEYLMSHPQERNANLLAYINRVAYHIAIANVYSGHPAQARYVLAKRPSNKLFGKILYCYLASMLPVRLIPSLRKIYHHITSGKFA